METTRYDILRLLRDKLSGQQIAFQLGISAPTVSEHIKKLKQDGLLELLINSKPRIYRITDKGEMYLTNFSMGSTQPNKPRSRLHALEVHYLLFRTEYAKLEAKLAGKGYPVEKSGNPKSPQYTVRLDTEMTMKLTTRKLIAWGPEIEKPIQVTTQEIESIALSKNMAKVTEFVAGIGIKCQRGLKGELIARLRYYEIAITNSELANKISMAERRSFIPLAWDRATGKPSLYLDHSFTWEMEGNKLHSYEPVRRWAQGIEDQEIRPYEDEMRSREAFNQIINALTLASQTTKENAKQIKSLNSKLEFYAANQATHIPLVRHIDQKVEEDRKLLKKILERLNQRKLMI